MLKTLSIRNVILIDKLDIELQNGFTVLSGETGAGKSILLDALGFLLGRRGDVGMVRKGCDKLSVCGCFEISDCNGEIAKLFTEHELDYEREIILKRTLSTDGRGKIFCNDQPITQKLLRQLGQLLVEVHGQFDNQGLLDQSTHQQVLDNYGDYGVAIKEMKGAFFAYKKAQDDRKSAETLIKKAKDEEEMFRHYVAEFQLLKPKSGEYEILEQKRQQLMNAEKILENLNVAYGALNKHDYSVRDAIRQAETAIARVNGVTNNAYEGIYTMLDAALINVEEAAEEIERVSNEINLSQKEIDEIEERLFALKDLARKHRVLIDELPHVWQQMENQLEHLEKGEDELNSLEKREKEAFENYKNKAQIVHEERLNAARHLDAAVQRELPDLKMEKARFKTLVEIKDEEQWNENGFDTVVFLISTNPGMPFGALNKIASGGELARFMLALKVNLAQTSQTETMIFDEVDTGIGGATAQAVGDKLLSLGNKVQVLVVTHSPQVAARSEHHFKVIKKSEEGTTTTSIFSLTADEKLEEVARMLSGEEITMEARAAAKVLIGG